MMCRLLKKLLTTVSISLFFFSAAFAADLEYFLEIDIQPEEFSASGKEVILYSPPFETNSLSFHLYWNGAQPEAYFYRDAPDDVKKLIDSGKGAAGITIESLQVNGKAAIREETEDPSLAVFLPDKPLKAGSKNRIEVEFSLSVPQERTARFGYSSSDRIWWFSQWFPKLGVLTGPGQWDAEPHSFYKEFFSDYAWWSLDVRVPEGYDVVSNLPEEAGDPSSFKGGPAGDAVFGVARKFYRYEEDHEGRLYRVVLSRENPRWARRILDRTIWAFSKMEKWVGPYPYRQFTVAELSTIGPVGQGMEYPLLINIVPGAGLNTVVDHEIAHQWFYGILGFNEAKEPWLDEGLTSYYELRLAREDEPVNVLGIRYTPFDIRYTVTGVANAKEGNVFVLPEEAASPEKAMVKYYYYFPVYLTLAERRDGTEAVDRFAQDLYSKKAFSHLSTEDVLGALRKRLSPESYSFFNALLYGARPDLALQMNEKKGFQVTATHPFLFPVDLHWHYQGEEGTVTFQDAGETEAIPFDYAYLSTLDMQPVNNYIVASRGGKTFIWIFSFIVVFLFLGAGALLKQASLTNTGLNVLISLPLFLSLVDLTWPLKVLPAGIYGLNDLSLFFFSLKEAPVGGALFITLLLFVVKTALLSAAVYKTKNEAYSFFHLLFVDGASFLLMLLLTAIMIGLKSTSPLLLFGFVFVLAMTEPVKASLLNRERKRTALKHVLPMSFIVTLFFFLAIVVLTILFVPLMLRSYLYFPLLVVVLSAGEYGYKLFYLRFYDYLIRKGYHESA